eukprot:3284681-Pleurochrysis_carterae.AAC.1
MCTPGLQPALSKLSTLPCTHRTHANNVGGKRDANGWQSAYHSAYPPDLNMLIANAVASRIALGASKVQPSPPHSTTSTVEHASRQQAGASTLDTPAVGDNARSADTAQIESLDTDDDI